MSNGRLRVDERNLLAEIEYWVRRLAGGSANGDEPGATAFGKTIKTISGSLTADAAALVAAVSGKRIKVIAYSLTSVGTNADTAIFKSGGTSGTELWRVLLQAASNVMNGANLATAAPSFLFGTVAGEALTLDVNQSDTVHYSVAYFDDDAE